MRAIIFALLGSCLSLVVYGVPVFPTFQHAIDSGEQQKVDSTKNTEEVSSAYAGTLSTNSGFYERVDSYSGTFYYYHAIQVKTNTAGTYTFMSDSTLDLVGYFHQDNFDPSVPSENLITEDDDNGDMILQFKLEPFLQAGHTYILVVTTHGESETGDFSITANGPDSITFEHITPTTSRPLLVSSMAPQIKTSFGGALTSESGLYHRVDGYDESFYHYVAIEIQVHTSGMYTLMSKSDLDLVGYLHNNNFDPSVPTENLITEDDDSGDGSYQFMIEVYLEAGHTYVLVVTTHGETETGDFSIDVSGPDSVMQQQITPVTSRPIDGSYIAPHIKTKYSSALTSGSGLFQRVDSDSESFYHYEAIRIEVHTSGDYVLMSESDYDLVGYFHKDNFDPSVPTENLITEDDDSGDGSYQFKIEVYLEAGHTYVLVVTTHAETATGDFSIEVSGPDSVILEHNVPVTSRPLLVPAAQVVSSYASELSSDSLIFHRPEGDSESKYYYHSFEISVPTSGMYQFTSESELDTMGYLYENSFEPADPTLNLISEDDDSGDHLHQFLLKYYLQEERKYILIVTTHKESEVGSFSVIIKGPANVDF